MPESVLLAGGGTAGHVNPLLSLADELRARDSATRITVLGTAEGLEAELVPARGYPLVVVPKVPLPRRPSTEWLALPGRLRAAVAVAEEALEDSGAQVVVGFGGYVATPAYLAARRRRVPIVVHEQNARPGLANRLGARMAAAVAVTFPGTRLPHAEVVGMPLRPEILALVARRAADREQVRREAAAELGLEADRPTLLVTGGSLGAMSVNSAVSRAAGSLLDAGAQVLHLTGAGKADDVREHLARVRAQHPADPSAGGRGRYQVREYLHRMDLGLAVADLVVCRSGAGTVSELTALGLPAVYVPLPVGNGEQRLNARAAVDAGGGLLVDDAQLDAAWVAAHVTPLLQDSEALAAMGRAAAGVGVIDAAARLADLVEHVA